MPSNSLEQEAMERVRRMYASFDSGQAQPEHPRPEIRFDTRSKRSGQKPAAEQPEQRPKPAAQPEKEPHPAPPKPQDSLLDIFLKDKDQSLILLLLALLMKDGADMNLMLALVYLLIS